MKDVSHIQCYLDKTIFDNGYELSTRFNNTTLLICISNQTEEKYITLEKYFDITKERKVTYNDFNII
ncbi:MAG: hypothetical protein IKO36_12480 [Bacteroidaceae bacterium]|nr:hypothetical protein [Bacteroidaceae bacterium]